MRDIFEVLKQKETEIQKLTREVEALRTAIGVLEADESGAKAPAVRASVSPINASPAARSNDAALGVPVPRANGLPQFP